MFEYFSLLGDKICFLKYTYREKKHSLRTSRAKNK